MLFGDVAEVKKIGDPIRLSRKVEKIQKYENPSCDLELIRAELIGLDYIK